MFKSARETAQVTREVLALQEDEERKRAEERHAAAAALAEVHAAFEHRAHAAAITGASHIVSPNHDLDLTLLRSQGFTAQRVTRRAAFQTHLEALCQQKEEELGRCADRLVAECDGLSSVEGDLFLHRNPLRSLMETLWRRGDLVPPIDPELFAALLRILTAADPRWIEANGPRLATALRLFEELKAAQAKRHSVTWENTVLADTVEDVGTYVTWESADDGKGLSANFCAQKMKWLALHWEDLAAEVQAAIEADAGAGRFESKFQLYFDDDSWRLDSSNKEYVTCCNPSMLMAALRDAGYELSLTRAEPGGERADSAAQEEMTPQELDFPEGENWCELRVRWGDPS